VDGPPYTAVVRLVLIAGEHWTILDGQAALRGHDLLDLPIRRFLNAVYAWAVERVGDRAEFDALLGEQDLGVDVTPEQVQEELADFGSFMQAVGVR
jgi:hypothetical protein